jgi:hypothetical protein
LLSALEYEAARVASWLGAVEIRTQFPLFPWSGHPHPMAGLDASWDACLPPTVGLLEIAHEAGIQHGSYVGAPDLPYVATTDLLVNTCASRNQRLAFWTVKPADVLRAAKPKSRLLERIELERLYAKSVGGTHVLYDGSHVSEYLLGNLDWLEPTRHERIDPAEISARARFVHCFNARPSSEPLRERIAIAASEACLEPNEGLRHFRAAAWLTEIDIDLSQPVLMSRPMNRGGNAFKNALNSRLTGEMK